MGGCQRHFAQRASASRVTAVQDSSQTPRRVLLVRPDKIGDLVLSLPVAAVLKERFAGVHVDVLASSYNAPLLRFSPHVDGIRLFTDATGSPRPHRDLVADLAAGHYDAAIFLKPGWPSAWAVFRAHIPRRIGTCRRSCSVLFNAWLDNKRKYSGLHEIDLNLQLLKPLGVDAIAEGRSPVLRVDRSSAAATCRALGLPDGFVVVHSGSGGSAANWPRATYGLLAERLLPHLPVVFTGKDRPPISQGQVLDLTNRTSFDQLVEVLASARAVVSGSTGPLHIAAALGTPAVGLYPNHPYLGPHRWAPRGPRVVVLQPAQQPRHACDLRADGSCTCMEGISVGQVLAETLRAAAHTPARRIPDQDSAT